MEGQKLFVGNLSFEAKEEEIRELFSRYGTVLNIRVRLRRGHAFVEMSDAAEAENVILNLDHKMFKGRELRITHELTSKKARIVTLEKYNSRRGESPETGNDSSSSGNRRERNSRKDQVFSQDRPGRNDRKNSSRDRGKTAGDVNRKETGNGTCGRDSGRPQSQFHDRFSRESGFSSYSESFRSRREKTAAARAGFDEERNGRSDRDDNSSGFSRGRSGDSGRRNSGDGQGNSSRNFKPRRREQDSSSDSPRQPGGAGFRNGNSRNRNNDSDKGQGEPSRGRNSGGRGRDRNDQQRSGQRNSSSGSSRVKRK